MQIAPDYVPKPLEVSAKEEHPFATSRLLRTLKQSFDSNPFEYPDGQVATNVDFLPRNVDKAVVLRKLPDEIVLKVLLELALPAHRNGFPKVALVEAFALVCRKGMSFEAKRWLKLRFKQHDY